MVTWWLVGQEEENRDSLTGMNLTKSESQLYQQRNSITKIVGTVKSESSLAENAKRLCNLKTVNFRKSCSDQNAGCSSSSNTDHKMSLPGTVVI